MLEAFEFGIEASGYVVYVLGTSLTRSRTV